MFARRPTARSIVCSGHYEVAAYVINLTLYHIVFKTWNRSETPGLVDTSAVSGRNYLRRTLKLFFFLKS